MFCSGFQTCAREVLQYLTKHENTRDLKSSQLVTHLHRVVSELLQGGTSRKPSDSAPKAMDFKEKPSFLAKGSEGPGKNCVPVIQRTFAPSGGEQSGSDTDTDSGYGGELEKGDLRSEQSYFKSDHGRRFTMGERVSTIKQESEEPPTKKSRMQLSDEEGHFTGSDLMGTPVSGPPPTSASLLPALLSHPTFGNGLPAYAGEMLVPHLCTIIIPRPQYLCSSPLQLHEPRQDPDSLAPAPETPFSLGTFVP